MKRFTKALKATTMAFAAVGFMATSAMATDGMYGNGTGARNKALAGAGVANEKDATAMSLNPAGLVHSENQLNISASLFSPRREHEGNYNLGVGAPAVVESDSQYFVIPNIAYSHRVDGNTVFGLSMYGNGGMNTDFPYAAGNPFGGTGSLGIDLTQIFMSAGLAKQYGNFSVGIAPIVAVQIFQADGIQTFSEETNVAVGIAVRGGVEWALTPNFRVGVSGATPTYMQAFTDYDTTLFAASNGELRLPATIQAGIAFDLTPSLTISEFSTAKLKLLDQILPMVSAGIT
jgi:long-chain fatty acid transport protein